MDEEEAEPGIEQDDCDGGGGEDGLTAKDVLKEAFDDLTEEIRNFVANQPLPGDVFMSGAGDTNSITTPISTSTTSKNQRRKQANVKESQKRVASDLLQIIQRSQPHIKEENFDYFDMFIIIPRFICLGLYATLNIY